MIVLDLREFHPSDFDRIRPQTQQADEFDRHRAEPQGLSWTALAAAMPICCGGLVEMWPGRAYAWSIVSADAGPHMLALTREIRSLLSRTPFARIEMAVAADFDAGRRWAELLGFVCETPAPMHRYLPDGRDAYLYART